MSENYKVKCIMKSTCTNGYTFVVVSPWVCLTL